ncbi:hypothetical protein ABE208_16205 [Bacillus inaquosorum]|uniref:hypothetical protein n=1 Tax=Bacillus inaquosorum TaxID=483913 RepID=UPI002280B3A3|nr:hypothetical protein [Bacillus inaquosorum]MCY9084310.1 hypothetical protein [Bacillus inaquosorum]
MKSLALEQLENSISNSNSAILIGNGFSINFDDCFLSIYERLYDSHEKIISKKAQYTIKGTNSRFKGKCKQNFTAVCRYLKFFTKKNLETLFNDGLAFANEILNNEEVLQSLSDKKMIHTLAFNISEIDVLKNICEVGNKRGYKYINLENWSILIFFYFAINELDKATFPFSLNNTFVEAIIAGHESKVLFSPSNCVIENTIMNGFSVYIRLLFSTAIYSNGKSCDFNQLEKLDSLNLNGIKNFLKLFKSLLSFNYDHIADTLLENNSIIHPHGKFIKNKTEYVYNQSLGLVDGNEYVSFSDIIIGDYFVYKIHYNLIAQYSIKNNYYNKIKSYYSHDIEETFKRNNIDTVLIFGMNIENDYHILRTVMFSLYSRKVKRPKIIYCYFNSADKDSFNEMYTRVVTFNDDFTNYVKQIELYSIRTQLILDKFFVKSAN